MRVFLPMALLTAPVLLAPAMAATPPARAMTCPIGGAPFDYRASPAPLGAGLRPDGKPYGAAAALNALPECPDNGLVLYKDYTPEEVAKLEPLIASEAYQKLRTGDTQYYRAYWLMKEMGLGPEDYLWALLQASWEADGKPELRTRYLTELADASGKVPPDPANLDWIGMEARSVNALRELSRFDEAAARLGKVPIATLDVQMPRGQDAAALREARTKRTWLAFFGALKAAIERKDASPEPFDLIPRQIAIGHCIDDAATLVDFGRAFCEKESASIDAMKANRAQTAKEMEQLRRNRDAAGR